MKRVLISLLTLLFLLAVLSPAAFARAGGGVAGAAVTAAAVTALAVPRGRAAFTGPTTAARQPVP